MKNCKRLMIAMIGILALSGVASAQGPWVDFMQDDSRLLGIPITTVSEDHEKDIAVADVDKDGDTDLAMVRKLPPPYQVAGPRQHVLLMNVNGTMIDQTATYCPDFLTPAGITDGRDVAFVDVDGDTWEDMVVVNTFDQNPQIYMNLGNDMQGAWQGFLLDNTGRMPNLVTPTLGPMFCEVAVGDFDSDGDPDMYMTDYENNLEDRIFMNNGSGYFTDETLSRVSSTMRTTTFGTGVRTADLNGDGHLDIIRSSGAGSPNAIRIAYNDGNGNFNGQVQDLNTSVPYMHATLDINRDGMEDVFVISDAQDQYFINQGNNPNGSVNWGPRVTLNNSPATAGFGGNVKVGDMNLDGYEDLVLNDVDIDLPSCARRLVILKNMTGTGAWQYLQDPIGNPQPAWAPNGTHDTGLLDIDGDGWLDMVIGTCFGTKVMMNKGKLALRFAQEPAGPGGGLSIAVKGGRPNTRHWILLSLSPVNPGTGPFFGLGSDAFTSWVELAGQPIVDEVLDANGEYSFFLPPPVPPFLFQARGLLAPSLTDPAELSDIVTTQLY